MNVKLLRLLFPILLMGMLSNMPAFSQNQEQIVERSRKQLDRPVPKFITWGAIGTYRVQQDFIFEETFFDNIGPVAIAGACITETFDINAAIKVWFVPNSAGDYDISVRIDPYKVIEWCGPFEDHRSEYALIGNHPLGAWEVKVRGKLTDPVGYWTLDEVSLGNGDPVRYNLRGGAAYGDHKLEVEFWNSISNIWKTKAFYFKLTNPEQFQAGFGYLVASGLAVGKSDFATRNGQAITHYSGTYRVFASTRQACSNEDVTIKLHWERVHRSGFSTYGSPYQYSPDRLIYLQLNALGKQNTWELFQYTVPNVYDMEVSNAGRHLIPPPGGQTCQVVTVSYRVTPFKLQISESIALTLGFNIGANYGDVSAGISVSGSVTSDYRIIYSPMTDATDVNDFCAEITYSPSIAPFNVTATDNLCDRVTVSWQWSGNRQKGFKIYRDGGLVSSGTDPNQRQWNDTQVIGNHNYTVSAYNGCGEGPQSNQDSGTRLLAPSVTPFGVIATDNFCDKITVNWQWTGSGQKGFKVYRDGGLIYSGTDPNLRQMDDTQVIGSHSYTVSAHNDCGEGPQSQSVQGKRLTKPFTPQNLRVTNVEQLPNGKFRIDLTWNDVDDEEKYLVYRDNNQIAETQRDKTTYTDDQAPRKNVQYYITAENRCGVSPPSNSVTEVKDQKPITEFPQDYELLQNHPNPFNPTTEISFQLPKVSDVVLTVFDISGHLIQTLVNEKMDAGFYKVQWRGEDTSGREVTSGVYFYCLQAGQFVQTKKMLLIR